MSRPVASILEPAVLAAVDLDQFAERLAPPAWLMKRPSLLPRQPQTGFDHPLAQGFGRNLQTVHLGQLLPRQRRPEVRVPFADQSDRMVSKLRRDLPIGPTAAQTVPDRTATAIPQSAQQTARLTRRDIQQYRC